MLLRQLLVLRLAALPLPGQIIPWEMDLSIPAVVMEVGIVKPACAVRLMGKKRIDLVPSFRRADRYLGTVARLLTTVALGVRATLVNAQGATSTSVMLDTVDTFSVVLCIECLEMTTLLKQVSRLPDRDNPHAV